MAGCQLDVGRRTRTNRYTVKSGAFKDGLCVAGKLSNNDTNDHGKEYVQR